jgi:hypothetical protein
MAMCDSPRGTVFTLSRGANTLSTITTMIAIDRGVDSKQKMYQLVSWEYLKK